jgi:hypothetical protein
MSKYDKYHSLTKEYSKLDTSSQIKHHVKTRKPTNCRCSFCGFYMMFRVWSFRPTSYASFPLRMYANVWMEGNEGGVE